MSVFVLNTTTKSLEAYLESAPAAVQPVFMTSYADNDGLTFTEGELDGALNSTNAVTVVAAPAASTRRTVRNIVIYNGDTADITVYLRLNNNSTYRILYKQTVSPGDSFDWPSGIVATGIDPTLYAKLASPVFTGGITTDTATITTGAGVGKVFVSNAGGLGTWGIGGTSYYSQTAGTSGYATTAANSGTSSKATSAANSGSASYATTAGNAGSASYATTAGNSGTASALNAPLTNLLTNTQWLAMSGSTLVEVTSGAAPVTDGANAALVNNLLANGGFDSATTSWNTTDCTIASVAGGKTGNGLEVTRTANYYRAYQDVTLTAGKLYTLSFWAKSGTAGDVQNAVSVKNGELAPAIPIDIYFTSSGSWTQYSTTFEAQADYTRIWLGGARTGAGAETALFDSITLYEVTPGYVAADTLGPDNWIRDYSSGTLTALRESPTANTKYGSFYALKLVGSTGSTNGHRIYQSLVYGNAQNRTVSFGAWIKASVANSCNLQIYGGSYTVSSANSGTDYEWLEVTATLGTGTTLFVSVNLTQAATVYISQPMLVYGSSIGQGNYAPLPNEQILLQSNVTLTGYTATTSATDGIINLEAASSGMIGKGVKAVLVKAYGKDSAAGDGVGFDVQSTSGVEDGLSIDTQANNVRVQGQGWVMCDSNGDIYFDHRGSGAAALTVDIKVVGIQTQ